MVENKYLTKHKKGGFQVMVYISGKSNYLGLFKTEEEARLVRDKFLKNNISISRVNQNHYVDNKELYIEIIISKAQGRLTRKALDILIKMVKEVNKKFRYNYIEDRYDVIAYSYEIIIKNWYNFDELVYSNAFAYYTEIIKRAHAFQWKQLQKNRINTISLSSYGNENKSMNI